MKWDAEEVEPDTDPEDEDDLTLLDEEGTWRPGSTLVRGGGESVYDEEINAMMGVRQNDKEEEDGDTYYLDDKESRDFDSIATTSGRVPLHLSPSRHHLAYNDNRYE